jgi:hypothetical protein
VKHLKDNLTILIFTPDCTVDDKIDGRIEDEEKVVEESENDEHCRIGKSILFGAEYVVVLQTLMRMNSLQ